MRHISLIALTCTLLWSHLGHAELERSQKMLEFLECFETCGASEDNGLDFRFRACVQSCEGPEETLSLQRDGTIPDCEHVMFSWDNDRDCRLTTNDHYLEVAETAGDTCEASHGGLQLLSACCTEGDACALEVVNPETGLEMPSYQAEIVRERWSDTRGYITRCSDNTTCGGFGVECTYVGEAGSHYCQERTCEESHCTAFHLEKVVEDANEVIAHVYFDYAPVYPTTLDLRLKYPSDILTLIDARPLDTLKNAYKEVRSSVTAFANEDVLRLVVLGTTTTIPIYPGPIIELVFRRQQPSESSSGLSFDLLRMRPELSMAPSPGIDVVNELLSPDLWGKNGSDTLGRSLSLGSMSAQTAPKELLYYSFDNRNYPLVSNQTLFGAELCSLAGDCDADGVPNLEGASGEKQLEQYSVLHSGVVESTQSVQGVSSAGAYLSGRGDHLELPPLFSGDEASIETDTSISMWFFREPLEEGDAETQIIFSHNTTLEETRYGIMLRRIQDSDLAELVWFEGDVGSQNLTTVPILGVDGTPVALPSLEWHHLALSLDSTLNKVGVYVDGQPHYCTQGTSGVGVQYEACSISLDVTTYGSISQCPIYNDATQDIDFVIEGAARNISPDQLLLASTETGLFEIERMDVNGLGRRRVVHALDSSQQTPDYSDANDLIAYASTASGNQEIWVAKSDGTEARRITEGFGDLQKGIFAQNPRWAPDGSGLAFESNAYSHGERYNTNAAYQLYYIPFNDGEVTVPQLGGEAKSQLVFSDILIPDGESPTRARFALSGDLDNRYHYYNAHWIGAADLVYTRSSLLYDDRVIIQSSIESTWLSAPDIRPDAETLPGLVESDLEEEAQLLAAAPSQLSDESTVLWLQGRSVLEDVADFQVNWNATSSVASIVYVGEAELKSTIDDIYVVYSREQVLPVRSDNGAIQLELGPEMAAKRAFGSIQEPLNGNPRIALQVVNTVAENNFTPGDEIVKISFQLVGTEAPELQLKRRKFESTPFVSILNGDDELKTYPLQFKSDGMQPEQILSASLEPKYRHIEAVGSQPETVGRFVLSGTVNARPAILVSDAIELSSGSAVSSLRLVADKTRVNGIDWLKRDRFYPCEWIGGYRNPSDGLYTYAFKGGIDELRVHNYARDPRAFVSDRERGQERLVAEGTDGTIPGVNIACTEENEHSVCPDYQICGDNGRCATVICDEERPCVRGLCTVVPISYGKTDRLETVCVADCLVDNNCFEQQCLNGPCRFCDEHKSCGECRYEQDPEFGIEQIVGCPDRTSFWCEDGSCLTECYSFENQQSTYLCDPASEYCHQGVCKLLEWEWSDIAPATFSGGSPMDIDLAVMQTPAYGMQSYPVTMTAFGLEDYEQPPSVRVQGRHGELLNGKWFDIGVVRVGNRTINEAKERPYTLVSSYPYEELGLQLVRAPHRNISGGATGLGIEMLRSLCQSDACLASLGEVEVLEKSSQFTWGYRQGIPIREANLDGLNKLALWNELRQERGQPLFDADASGFDEEGEYGALTFKDFASYLYANGHPSVIILQVEVGAARTLVQFGNDGDVVDNTICEEGLVKEKVGLDFGVLNCISTQDEQIAQLHIDVSNHLSRFDLDVPGNVILNGNACWVRGSNGNDLTLCYEIEGGGSLDYLNSEKQTYRTLEFELFQSFGEPTKTVSKDESVQ